MQQVNSVKFLIISFVFSISFISASASDTTALKNLYDRCLDFSEDKADSILYYAELIKSESDQLNFDKGDVLSLRLKGIYEEMNSNYPKAISYYLESLDAARKIRNIAYETAALSDLAILYANIKNPYKAKEFYLQCAQLSRKQNQAQSIVSNYNNLAAIYTQLGQYDSAQFFLEDALKIGKPIPEIDLSSTYNNLGNVYFHKKNYDKAIEYFRYNYNHHIDRESLDDLWVDHLNLADVFIEMKKFDSASWHADRALKLAIELQSRSKEADSYSMLAKMYARTGKYSKAYEMQAKWYTIDTGIVNKEMYASIAGLQERFHAKEREHENKLLVTQVEKEKYRVRSVTLLAISFAILGVLIAIAFVINRKVNKKLKAINEMVVRQNERLAELNNEKNSLMSIVSHDLGTPFATIQMWAQVLQADKDGLTADQNKAVNKILTAGNHGEELIRRILDVERAHIGQQPMHLENFELTIFIEQLGETMRPGAMKKNIKLHYEKPNKEVYLLSDKQMVHRICENLLSNAIKFSPTGKNVWVSVSEEGDAVQIKVRDEGIGISAEDLPHLFSRYSKLSSKPTEGEASTGLGLSIVKRIVEELNGTDYLRKRGRKGITIYSNPEEMTIFELISNSRRGRQKFE